MDHTADFLVDMQYNLKEQHYKRLKYQKMLKNWGGRRVGLFPELREYENTLGEGTIFLWCACFAKDENQSKCQQKPEQTLV